MAAFLDRIRTRTSDSLPEHPEVQAYLTGGRKLPESCVDAYKVGYTDALTVRPEDSDEFRELKKETRDFKGLQRRILFPATNCIGGTLGFSTRRLVDELDENGKKYPRYRTYMSPEAKVTGAFFGIEQALPAMVEKGFVYVVEGAVDCMSMSLAFPNVVSTLTSMVTESQMWTLSMLVDRVVVAFDSDEPGRKGAEMLRERYGDKVVKVMELGYHDANTALVTLGHSAFKRYANNKLKFVNFTI